MKNVDISIKDLIYFVTAVDNSSLTRASEILEISQSTLSMSLIKLESFYEQKLYERTSRGIRPTDAGTKLYSSSKSIINEYEKMNDIMMSFGKTKVKGSYSIGYPSMMGQNQSFVRTVKSIKNKYPEVTISLESKSSLLLIDGLLKGKYDSIFTSDSYKDLLKDSDYVIETLYPIGYGLIVSDTNRFSEKRSVSMSELKNETVYVLSKEKAFKLNEFVKIYEKEYNLKVVEMSSMLEILAMVRMNMGVGIAITPDGTGSDGNYPDIRVIDIKERKETVPNRIFCYNDNSLKISQELIDEFRKNIFE